MLCKLLQFYNINKQTPWPESARESCRQQAEVIQNHENENVPCVGQGEARHRKYKRLKLGGGHLYDRSSVQTAVVA
jgi:hypothetical protein